MTQKRKDLLDLRHPVFRPMWRRAVLVVFLGVWTVIELVNGNPFWAMLVAGIGGYAVYVFFFDFDRNDQEMTNKDTD